MAVNATVVDGLKGHLILTIYQILESQRSIQQLAKQFRHTSKFSSTSKCEETQSIDVNSIEFFPKIHGQSGTSDLKEWPLTIGMYEKDPNNVNGKRVMVKVDSRPGRLQEDFLAEARTLGFIVYPGVPNTTAVTQETDQNYIPSKTHFFKMLRECRTLELWEIYLQVSHLIWLS
eukprot:CCRYP_015049-RA/>CCRYP_015049-RA protein AED:0.35 eAED:0.50 QI:0/0/0/1/0/0/3/0/173